MQDDIARAIFINNGSCLSISEHETIVSRIKSEAAQAHAKVLESTGMLNIFADHKKSDAIRIEPIFKGGGGHAYWKLNCIGKSDVLHQNIEHGESPTFDEKWFAIDAEGKEAIEKHTCSLSSDVYSYDEDASVVDPLLAQQILAAQMFEVELLSYFLVRDISVDHLIKVENLGRNYNMWPN